MLVDLLGYRRDFPALSCQACSLAGVTSLDVAVGLAGCRLGIT